MHSTRNENNREVVTTLSKLWQFTWASLRTKKGDGFFFWRFEFECVVTVTTSCLSALYLLFYASVDLRDTLSYTYIWRWLSAFTKTKKRAKRDKKWINKVEKKIYKLNSSMLNVTTYVTYRRLEAWKMWLNVSLANSNAREKFWLNKNHFSLVWLSYLSFSTSCFFDKKKKMQQTIIINLLKTSFKKFDNPFINFLPK